MRRNSGHKYAGISTLRDFDIERKRLVRNKKNIERQIDINFRILGKLASLSTNFAAIANEQIVPKISAFLADWLKNNGKHESQEINPE